jgi:hypothetical protein
MPSEFAPTYRHLIGSISRVCRRKLREEDRKDAKMM